MGRTGFAFSLDLTVAFVAMLLMLSLMFTQLNLVKEEQLAGLEKLSLQERAIFLIDSMVKNRNLQQPFLGSALYDPEKHRILQNQLDPEILLNAREADFGKFSVSRPSFTGNRVVSAGARNCISLDRIVLIEGMVSKVEVTVCEK
jgi:hypothetical protein